MAPKKAKEAGGGGGSKPKKGAQEKSADDEFLDKESAGRWSDGFVILSLLHWLVDKAVACINGRANGGAPSPSSSSKRKDKDETHIEPKEMVLQWLSDFKIPVGLMTIFVLTCALIIGGESFGRGDERRGREQVDDFYGTLGVERDADTAEVKRAYKTLAKRWHPDRNPNCTSCQETFAKIATAYETLADTEKRAAYDESGDIATAELKSPRSVPLTRDNFDELVTFSNDVWIVQIFKPDDGSCAQFHPFWENQIQKNGHLVRFGRVDVTNDQGKWLPVKPRVLPMVLKYGRHLGSPEIFPITATHQTPQQLMKFVLTSFPNIGLPLHKDPFALKSWLSGSTRRHKVLFAIPGKSEEERYKSHLVPRKLAARWSELFEFRTAETAVLHELPTGAVSKEVLAALPNVSSSANQAAVLFFSAGGGAGMPRATAIFSWPTGEEELVLQLLRLAELAAPTLSARSAELLCKSLPVKRVYCLVMLDPPDSAVAKAASELTDSRARYTREVADIREQGGEVQEDEDNFVVPALRLFRQPRGLQPSVATCRAPQFEKVEKVLGGANAFLMDLDMGRMAALKGVTSFRGIYPQIAYEDSLAWSDDALHPFLSLPDCDEGMLQHYLRTLRNARAWELIVQFLSALLFVEALAKAICEQSWRWSGGAAGLLLLMLLRSPPFLRSAASYLPGFLIAPPLLVS